MKRIPRGAPSEVAPGPGGLSVRKAPGSRERLWLRLLEWGSPSAPALVLLHGGGAHADWWRHIGPVLASERRVVALDLRGHGESDRAPGHYGMDRMVDDLGALIDRLGGEVDVVGASMGGIVATHAAARGLAIRRLVIVDAPPKPPGDIANRRAVFGTAKRYASLEEGLRRFRPIPPDTFADPELIASIARRSFRRLDDGAFGLKFDHRMFQSERPDPPADLLERIEVSTLLIRGSHSLLLDECGGGAHGARIPRCRLVTIPRAHHHVFLDNPEGFLVAVSDFLAEADECNAPGSAGRG